MPSRLRCALLVAAMLAAPALLSAQARAGTRRVELVVVTAASVKVRSAPYGSSLSIEEFGQGSVFHVAADEYQSKDWIGVVLDSRIAFVPRDAVAPRAFGARASVVAEASPVSQSGLPATAPSAVMSSEPAPAVVASRPMPAEPAPRPAVSQAAPVEAPRSAPIAAAASAPAPQTVASAPQHAAEHQPEPGPAAQPARAAEPAMTPASDRNADSPAMRVRRPSMGLTVGVFGSVTPIRNTGVTAGMLPTAHVSGLPFIGIRYRMLGLYGAPEFGQGGGYKSTMFGGGGSLDLLRLHMLHVTVLGGYTTYSETPILADSTIVPVTRTMKGTSVGGMVSIPFIGPLRLGYRGQYVMTRDVAGVSATMTRHYAGLVF